MQGVVDVAERRKDWNKVALLQLYTSAFFNCLAAREGHSKARRGKERSKKGCRPTPTDFYKLLNVDCVAKKSIKINREIK